MRGPYYVLDEGGNAVPAKDVMEWARFFEDVARRTLSRDELDGGVVVSTVFLGLDSAWGSGPPVLWETMIFGGAHDRDSWRYASRHEALAGHALALMLARESMAP